MVLQARSGAWEHLSLLIERVCNPSADCDGIDALGNLNNLTDRRQ